MSLLLSGDLKLSKPTTSSVLITPQTKVPVDPNISDVTLLLHGDGTNGSTTITDNSPVPKTVTANGNAQISTTQSKFGGASIAFDGTGDYLLSATRSEYALPGDFTIECWVRQNSTAALQGIIVKRRLDSAETGTWGIGINAGTFFFQKLQVTVTTTNFGTSTANTWQHIAVSREGSSIRCFLNGTLNATVTDSTNYTNARPLVIGAWDRGGIGDVPTQNWLNGYIDDLRITKGIARYTANFTPPTAPFPDI